jgi:hypothetical protein
LRAGQFPRDFPKKQANAGSQYRWKTTRSPTGVLRVQSPKGEYGAGEVKIADAGTYETLEWTDERIEVVLHGKTHTGEIRPPPV